MWGDVDSMVSLVLDGGSGDARGRPWKGFHGSLKILAVLEKLLQVVQDVS